VQSSGRAKLEEWIEEGEHYRMEYAEHWNRDGKLEHDAEVQGSQKKGRKKSFAQRTDDKLRSKGKGKTTAKENTSPKPDHTENSKHSNIWNPESMFPSGPDILITPVAPWIASPHGTAKYWSYTSLWNLLNYPALSMPSPVGTHASAKLDVKINRENGKGENFMSDIDRKMWDMYDPALYDGMPVSIQLIGRRLEDEKVLAVAQFLEDHLKTPSDSPIPSVPSFKTTSSPLTPSNPSVPSSPGISMRKPTKRSK